MDINSFYTAAHTCTLMGCSMGFSKRFALCVLLSPVTAGRASALLNVLVNTSLFGTAASNSCMLVFPAACCDSSPGSRRWRKGMRPACTSPCLLGMLKMEMGSRTQQGRRVQK